MGVRTPRYLDGPRHAGGNTRENRDVLGLIPEPAGCEDERLLARPCRAIIDSVPDYAPPMGRRIEPLDQVSECRRRCDRHIGGGKARLHVGDIVEPARLRRLLTATG